MLLGDEHRQLGVVDVDRRSSWKAREIIDAEAERLRACRPPLSQLALGDVFGLGSPGVEGGSLRALRRVRAVPLHRGHDLPAAPAELLAEGFGNARHVGVPLLDLLEEEAHRPGQLVAQDGLVDEAGRSGVAIHVAGVEGGPFAVIPLGQVGNQDVRVQCGVREAAGSVPEAGRHEAGRCDHLGAGMATPDVAGVALEVGDGGVHRPLMAVDHSPSHVGIA